MKTILIGLTLLASLNAFSAQTEEYTGTGLTGDSCTLSIGPALDSDYDNVLFRAKIGGKAIPQFLGFGTSKYFKSFAMVQFEHDGRLVSVGSEGDPDLEEAIKRSREEAQAQANKVDPELKRALELSMMEQQPKPPQTPKLVAKQLTTMSFHHHFFFSLIPQ